MFESPSSFHGVGLPAGQVSPVLAYHPPTGSIIAHTRARQSTLPCRRLFLRRANERQYRPIGNFDSSVSVESLALHPHLPLFYFITFTWSRYANGPVGGNWEALHRFDLNTFQNEVVARRGELAPPSGYQTAWLNELLSAGDDGNVLFCRAGLRNTEPVHYCLSKLSIPDRKLTIISRLEATFA